MPSKIFSLDASAYFTRLCYNFGTAIPIQNIASILYIQKLNYHKVITGNTIDNHVLRYDHTMDWILIQTLYVSSSLY